MPTLFSYLSFLLFLSSTLQTFHLNEAQIFIYRNCDNTAENYTSGSVYDQNIQLTLSSLVAGSSQTGFNTTVIGQNTNVVYGLVQCNVEVSSRACQTCLNTAADRIRTDCPNQKEAFIGYDLCILRYSYTRFFSTVESLPRFGLYNNANSSDRVTFNDVLMKLVGKLSPEAASSPLKFEVGDANYTGDEKVYARLQCTRDLSQSSCENCLNGIADYMPSSSWCNGKVGCQIFSKSCNIRYEMYSFFSALTEPPPSLLETNLTVTRMSNETNLEANKNTRRVVLLVVIPVVATLLVSSLICACFLLRNLKRKRDDTNQIQMLIWLKTIMNMVSSLICACFVPRKLKRKRNDVAPDDETDAIESLSIGLGTLKQATENFSNAKKLGEGGFGPVYKGKLPGGHEIAVKRLSNNSVQGLKEHKTEVESVAKLFHRNLVRLLGFCLEDEEKLLVYEYLPNGSLDKVLFDEGRQFCLEWERRYKIIVGIARGLLYLHEDSQFRVIHCDLKASNILLDRDMNPKISDFGLAKLFNGSQIQGKTSRISGTFGYMAPEYAKSGNFSMKSDVYSFGILVLEIITGRKNSRFWDETNLQSHAWHNLANGTPLELIDPALQDEWPRHEVLKCIHMALLCVQEAAIDRPRMSEVVSILDNCTVSHPVPSRPGFFVTDKDNCAPSMVRQDAHASEYNISITELQPRD